MNARGHSVRPGLMLIVRAACAFLIVPAFLSACHDPASPPLEPRPPLRIDLTELLPRVESDSGEVLDIEPSLLSAAEEAKADGSLAPVVVLDRALGKGLDNPQWPGRRDLRLATKARAVEHRTDLRLAWTLVIPDAARLTFRPAVPTNEECSATYRLELRTDNLRTTLFERDVSGPPLWESSEETLDLAQWAGQTVDLEASGSIEPSAAAAADRCAQETLAWISPVIWSSVRSRPLPRGRPNVILIGLDTVRADRLGAWGNSPSPTPALDRLAEESDVFAEAYSAFNVTNPSFVSLHTGLYGKNHGVYELDVPVAQEATTLAELFSEQGYATQAVVSATHLHDRASGLGQGFDGVHVPWGQYSAEEVVRRGLSWLEGIEDYEMSYFLWLHFFDAHTPHLPPKPYAFGKAPANAPGLGPVRDWIDLRPNGLLQHVDLELGAHPDSYDEGLAYLDRQIGRLMDALEHRGWLESTWIVVVSDHGENLTEHGLICRHAGLFDTTLHVPLMIRPPGPPGQKGRRFDHLVQSLDLFPTLLRAVGIKPPASDGIDLYRLAEAGGRPAVFAEHAHATGAAVRTERYFYARQEADNQAIAGVYFFDVQEDPQELNNLAGRGLAAETEMAQTLDRWLQDRQGEAFAGQRKDLSPEEESQLRALGYVD